MLERLYQRSTVFGHKCNYELLIRQLILPQSNYKNYFDEIFYRTILTAAHCICNFVDKDRNKEFLYYCNFNEKSGSKDIPANQQILYEDETDDEPEKDLYRKYIEKTDIYVDDFNEILVYVGAKDLKNANKADAERAYVIDTLIKEDNENEEEEEDQHPSLTSKGYDIGIIIMKDDFDDKKIPNFNPICLPQK